MSILPNTNEWTYEQYALIPNDGLRHEIVNGAHFMNPAPNLYHQTVSRRIQFQLYRVIEIAGKGVVFNAPVDVQLSNRDIVQPDLVVIETSRQKIMTPTKIKGIPNLLVEILSPSNADYDLKKKRELYERSGVPEYWIVLPDEQQVIQLSLIDGRYQESIHHDAITMIEPPQATVDLTQVW